MRRHPFVAIAAALVIGALGYGFSVWRYWQTHVSTDDAYVEARVSPVSAKISGNVIEVLVKDNQEVKAGAPVVRLDPRDYDVKLQQARAAVMMARGGEKGASAGVPLSEESTGSMVQQGQAALHSATLSVEMAASVLEERRGQLKGKRAAVSTARSAVQSAEADFERARLERERSKQLLAGNLVAQRDFDFADATFKTTRATVDAARTKLEEAQADVQRTEAELASQTVAVAQSRRRVEESEAFLAQAQSQRRQVGIRRAEAETASGRLAEALANLREAELKLEYTTIRAPQHGRVTKKSVEVGQVIQPGQPLLAVVSTDDVWVVANYKETELTSLRAGQPVTITIDTYPGVKLKARVDSIQAGTGSRFSLLPPENASGNFVKVVQRIPVKIVLEPDADRQHVLRPGMSVVPIVQIR
jgi:membrane fusion protein (multidrug efflux system)